MGGFLDRVFKAGALPPEITAALDGATPLLVASRITVKASGKLKSPQRRSSGFTKMHSGVLVILPDRVLASFGRYLMVDDVPAATPADPTTTTTTCTIDATGLRVTIDVERLIPGGSGHVDLDVRAAVPPEALAALAVPTGEGRVAAPDPAHLLMRI